jgi:hypothetical protein
MFEVVSLQIELAQRAPFGVEWSKRGESLGVIRVADYWRSEQCILREKKVAQKGILLASEIADVAIHFRHNPGIEAQTREVVVHLHLMLQHHQGGDVTRWAQVLAGVEKPAEVSEVAEMILLLRRSGKGFGTDEISTMSLSAMLALDEPPRSSVGNWGTLIDVLHLTLSVEFAR